MGGQNAKTVTVSGDSVPGLTLRPVSLLFVHLWTEVNKVGLRSADVADAASKKPPEKISNAEVRLARAGTPAP